MKIRGSSTSSMRVPAGVVLHRYLLLISIFLALSLLCEPAMAVGLGHGGAPRYAAVPGIITVTDAAGLVDLMDPANVGVVCLPGTVVRLAANIDMGPFPLVVGEQDPTPGAPLGNLILGAQIGTDTNPFQGTFDGTNNGANPNGFVIRNLKIIGGGNRVILGFPAPAVPPATLPQVITAEGLFGVVQRLALASPPGTPNIAIRNLILQSPLITGFATDVGGLVGRLNQGTIFQCCVVGPGNITAAGNGPNRYLGGLVGQIVFVPGLSVNHPWDDPTVSECFAKCDVRGPANVGGLVGAMNGTLNVGATPGAYVQNSYAAGHTVNGAGIPFDGLPPSLGGLVGLNNLGAITACYADTLAPVRGDPTVGAPLTPVVGSLVGTWVWANAATITNFSEVVDCPISAPTGVGAGTQPGYAAIAWPAVPPPRTLTVPGTYAAWGIGTIWAVPVPGQTPRLLWQNF